MPFSLISEKMKKPLLRDDHEQENDSTRKKFPDRQVESAMSEFDRSFRKI